MSLDKTIVCSLETGECLLSEVVITFIGRNTAGVERVSTVRQLIRSTGVASDTIT